MGQARLPCWISAAILVGMGLVEGFAHFGIPSQIYGSWPVKADRGALALLSGIAIGLGLVGRHRAASALAGIAVGLSGMRVTQALVGGLPNDALSILASLGFFLGSAALVCVHRCRRPWVALGPALAILPLVGSAGFLFAFMLDSEIVSPAEVLNSISPHAASAILLLAAAVLFQAIPGWRRDGHYSPRFVIVTTLAAMASLAFTIWLAVILANHVQAIKQAELQTATAANFLDEHLERSLDGPDLLTRKVAEVIREDGGLEALTSSPREWQKVVAAKESMPQVNAVVVADPAGTVVFHTQRFPFPPTITVSDRTYFKLHRDGIERYIGSAILARSGGNVVFTYSRRVQDASGRMLAIVLVSIDARYFEKVFDRLGLGARAASGLLRINGDVLALDGKDGEAVGGNFADFSAFQNLASIHGETIGRGSLDDNVQRIVAIRRNFDLGTIAFASLPLTTALADWWKTVAATGAILAAILGATVTLGVLGHRSILREERLKERSDALAAFQDAVISSAATAIIATDRSGTITLFNAAAERLLGWRAEEMVGQRTPEQFHDGNEVVQRAAELSALLGRRVPPGFDVFVARLTQVPVDEREWTYIRKDGSKVPVLLSVSALRGGKGAVTGYLGVAIDMSARRKAERDLRHSETRLRAIVDNVMDAIITINSAGIVQSFNPAAERMFGISVEEAIGANVSMLMDEPHRSQHDGYLQAYLATGQAKIIGIGREVEAWRKDGSTFPAELTVTDVDLVGRRLFVGVIRDLSERKKIERLKSEFVSTVSHELRTPLTAIRGSLSLVNSGVLGDVPDEVKELTEVAERSSERLVLLINDILDVEKIGSGQLKLDIVPLRVDDLLARGVADTKAYADKFGIRLRAEHGAGTAEIRADGHRMIQVLANLISNAVKFSPSGAEVVVSSATLDGRVRLSVTDQGQGIPEHFRPHIFEKFAQADASDAKVKGGTGLGLAITKGLVERMGGTIGFVTETGQGTSFHVEFPSIAEAATDRRMQAGALRLLHVEDDEATRMMVARHLGPEFHVIGAASVEEAISRAQSGAFDMAVIDLGLPDGSGLEVLPHLEGQDGRPPPVAVYSASDDPPENLPPNVVAVLVKSRLSERDLAATLKSLVLKEDRSA